MLIEHDTRYTTVHATGVCAARLCMCEIADALNEASPERRVILGFRMDYRPSGSFFRLRRHTCSPSRCAGPRILPTKPACREAYEGARKCDNYSWLRSTEEHL